MREEAQVFDADICVGVGISFGLFVVLTGVLVGPGLCHALGTAAAGTSVVLGQGPTAWVYYGTGEHRARLVGGHIENDEYMVGSPDFDVFVEPTSLNNGDLEGIRFSATADGRARGGPSPGGDTYIFAVLAPAEVIELRAEANQVCNLERASCGLPRAFVVVDGGAATLEQLVEGADIARWASARRNFLCDGFRIPPQTPKERTLVDTEGAMRGPVDGAARVDSVVEGGVVSLVGDAGGRRHEDGIMCHGTASHEHAILHRAVALRVTMGGFNVKNGVGVVGPPRHPTWSEEAEAQNPEAPSYDGTDHYLGICEGSGEAQAVSSPWAHEATELSVKATSMREKRKATEARAAGYAIAKAKADPAASVTK